MRMACRNLCERLYFKIIVGKSKSNVTIDDFCKIVGPTYIGADSFVGMSSLIRKSMMGVNTRIGFNCEVGKTYLEGHARISHQNVILDSII